MPTLDDHLLPTLLRQHWLIALDDIAAAGGADTHARDRVRSGRWERVDRGVYHPVGAPLSWQARHLAPILAARLDGATVLPPQRRRAARHPWVRTRETGARDPSVVQPPASGRARAHQRGSGQDEPGRDRRGPDHGAPADHPRRGALGLGRTAAAHHRMGAPRTGRGLERPGLHPRAPCPAGPAGCGPPPAGARRQRPSSGGDRQRLRAARSGRWVRGGCGPVRGSRTCGW
jgi:hypothetical protein